MSARSRRFLAMASSSAVAITGVALSAAPATATSAVQCGDVITQSTRLTHDLVCDGSTDALVIGASGIVLDLGGRTITGPGAYQGEGSGVRVAGHSGVTIQRGTITGFQAGVVLDSGPGNTVNRMTLTANDRGVDIANAPGTVVSQSTITGNGRDGVAVGGAGSAGTVVSQNTIAGNTWGVTVNATPDARLLRNRISDSVWGIAVFAGASGAVVSQNTVTNSAGDGIEISGDVTGSQVSRNTSSFNGGFGFRLYGTGTAERNTAESNGLGGFDLGPDMTDAGGNTTL
jgi:hypothetical protein